MSEIVSPRPICKSSARKKIGEPPKWATAVSDANLVRVEDLVIYIATVFLAKAFFARSGFLANLLAVFKSNSISALDRSEVRRRSFNGRLIGKW